MYSSASSVARRESRRSKLDGSGTLPVTSVTMPGLVPQVTCGANVGGVEADAAIELRALVGA